MPYQRKRMRKLGEHYLMEIKTCDPKKYFDMTCRRCWDVDTSEELMVKIFSPGLIYRDGLSEALKFEVATMVRTGKHPNLVCVREILASRTKAFAILEGMTGEDLFDALVTAGRFNEKLAQDYMKQLVDGVDHCHRSAIFHRDLKLDNVFLDREGKIKIAGFSLAANFDPVNPAKCNSKDILHTTASGSRVAYAAPEIFTAEQYGGRAADVWSLGVIMYAMLVGFLPFEASSISERLHLMKMEQLEIPKDISLSARSLLKGILHHDPDKRFSIAQIREHPWFSDTLPGTPLEQGNFLSSSTHSGQDGECSLLSGDSVPVNKTSRIFGHHSATTTNSSEGSTTCLESSNVFPTLVEKHWYGSDNYFCSKAGDTGSNCQSSVGSNTTATTTTEE
ncbi:unnamed protein product [Choristocarpus tenellus]